MVKAIIERIEEDDSRGRPKSNNKFCVVCGIELALDTARENKKGNGSFRKYCKVCEAEKARLKYLSSHQQKDKKYVDLTLSDGRVLIRWFKPSYGQHKQKYYYPLSGEYSSPVHQIFCKCDECGGIVSWEEREELVCRSCGLVHEELQFGEYLKLYDYEDTRRCSTENHRARKNYPTGKLTNSEKILLGKIRSIAAKYNRLHKDDD